jgi:hypothetical protein
VAAVTTVGVVANDAAAATGPRAAGWWTSSPLPHPPDVADRLLVQGGPEPDRPIAFAALAFDLPPGETAVALTLSVAPGSLSSPVAELAACALREDFEPDHGAPMSEAPAYDCSTLVPAAPEGGSYTFFVGALAGPESLSVAILPVTPADRVVLEVPGVGALQTIGSGGPVADEPPERALPLPANGTTAPPTGPAVGHGSLPAIPLPAPSLPAPAFDPGDRTAAPAEAGDENPLRAIPPATVGPEPAATFPGPGTDPAANPLAQAAFVVLAAAATALWLRAGRADLDEPEGSASQLTVS